MALMKALSRNTTKQKWLLFWCKTWDLNDFRFLQTFIALERRSGVLESLWTRRYRVRSRAGAHFNSPIVVAYS